MKIVLVIPTLKQGGAERVISELANEWARNGHDVYLILLSSYPRFYPLSELITVYELSFENSSKMGKIKSEISTLFKLRKLLIALGPDFVLSFMDKYNILTLIATRFSTLNIFISDRSSPAKKNPLYIEALKIVFYRFATGIIAQTEIAKESLLTKIHNHNISVIPNPIRHIREMPLLPREKIILNIGRLIPQKGQELLLSIFSRISDQRWKLVILGEGPFRSQLEHQAKELEISDRVLMPGSLANLDDWLAKSSIFAFTSLSEGFPNSLAEAMSAGLACISFDCVAGPSDLIVDGDSGFLIPIGNEVIFLEKLNDLIGDETLLIRIGQRGKHITRKLNVSQIAEKYLDFCATSIKN